MDAFTDIKTQPTPQTRFEDGLTHDSKEIISKIKWQLDFTQKKQSEAFNPETVKKQLDGLLRGDFAERLSLELTPQQCKTVYNPSNIDITQYRITNFESLPGHKTKEGILAYAVKKSLKDSPPKNLVALIDSQANDETHKPALMDQITEEIVAGYSSKGKDANSGIFFGDTVIPDAALVNNNNEITGPVEVKAYFPDELHRLVVRLNKDAVDGKSLNTHVKVEIKNSDGESTLNLGVDLDKEIEFVDILRSVGFGLPELHLTMPTIIRFPNDIPDDLIANYGEILTKCGYKVVLQKIPMTTEELSKKTKEFVKNNLEAITNRTYKTMSFSDREIAVLKEYAEQATS